MNERRTEKKGFTLVEILIVVMILAMLAAIVIPQFTRIREEALGNWREIPPGLKTDVWVMLVNANAELEKEAKLLYEIENRWTYSFVQFKDIGLNGNLDQVYCKKADGVELRFDPNSEYPEGKSWDDWLERFSKIRKEAVTGLRPGAEEFLQTEAKKEEE